MGGGSGRPVLNRNSTLITMPKDAQLTVTRAFPAANANANCTAIDLGARTSPGGTLPSDTQLEISWEALPNLVDSQSITFTVQDSADNSSFTSLRITHVITGGTGNGLAAGKKRVHLPADIRRYVNVNAAVGASAGNNTAQYFTVAVVVGES